MIDPFNSLKYLSKSECLVKEFNLCDCIQQDSIHTAVNGKPLLIRNPNLEQSDALQPSNEAIGYNMLITEKKPIFKERVDELKIYPSYRRIIMTHTEQNKR